MNIVFWNWQGLRPKRRELQNYLPENEIDILALNETYLEPKHIFHLPGYDIYKNERLVRIKGGTAILVRKGIIVKRTFQCHNRQRGSCNKIELQNVEKVILATIYCPNGNPSLRISG